MSIPYGVTEIGEGAFNDSDLEWVDIPDTVTSIGKYAFASTKLRTAVLPDSVTNLGEGYQGALSGYGDKILLVGINYDAEGEEKKHHTCVIEEWME